jgi:hypothetical protein
MNDKEEFLNIQVLKIQDGQVNFKNEVDRDVDKEVHEA